MRESRLEQKLRNDVQKLGGIAAKFVSPGLAGVPDRIVLLPGGRVVFAEMKKPGEKPRPLQRKRIADFQALGHEVWVLDSEREVNRFVQEVFR